MLSRDHVTPSVLLTVEKSQNLETFFLVLTLFKLYPHNLMKLHVLISKLLMF